MLKRKEPTMARKYFDCREHPAPEPSEQCTVAISADSDNEVVEAAVDHVVQVHGYEDTPELRDQVRAGIKEGTPPL
jgi:predicted small metal-binding protein